MSSLGRQLSEFKQQNLQAFKAAEKTTDQMKIAVHNLSGLAIYFIAYGYMNMQIEVFAVVEYLCDIVVSLLFIDPSYKET